MKRQHLILVFIVVLAAIGCSDDPLVGQRMAQAEGVDPGQASKPTTPTSAPAGDSPIARMLFRGAEAGTENTTPAGSASPDGRLWVFGSDRGIVIRDLSTGLDRVLVAKSIEGPNGLSAVDGPRFSPDGSRVEYIQVTFGLSGAFVGVRAEVRSIGLDGAGDRLLIEYTPTGEAMPNPLDWSREGRHMALLLSGEPNSNTLAVYSSADKQVKRLKTFDWRTPDNVAFSPDGRFIAYDFQPDEKSALRDVFVMATNGSRETAVAAGPADDKLLGWAPDGRLMFLSDRAGTPGAYITDIVDGRAAGQPRLVKADLFRYSRTFGIGQNGSLYYQIQPTARDVYSATLDSATMRVLVPPASISATVAGANEYPRWSPDGRTLAFIAYRIPRRSGGHRIVLRSADTGDVREIRPDMQYIARFVWLPDGTGLIAEGQDARARSGLFRVDIRTGAVSTIWLRDPQHAVPDQFMVSRDGTSLLYLQKPAAQGATSRAAALVSHHMANDLKKEIWRFSDAPALVNPSPDGRLAYAVTAADGQSRVFVMPENGGEPRQVYASPKERVIGGSVNWVDAGHLMILTRLRNDQPGGLIGSEQLWRVSMDTGTVTTSDFQRREGLAGPQLHPDGRRIVFETGRPTFEIWVLEHAVPGKQTPGRK